MGLLCVSIDLDEVDCYYAIHGIAKPQNDTPDAVYCRALPRAFRFLEEHNIQGTFFAVGTQLMRQSSAAALLRDLVQRGHEVANHTMHHRYDLTVLTNREQAAEIDQGAQVIQREIGSRPLGFRAPGYNIHTGITDILVDQGYVYDSSVFPCPIYYSAKTMALGIKSIQGKRSASTIGDPRVLQAPTGPYQMGTEGVWSRGTGLTELPISVVTRAKLPFIGSSLALMGGLGASLLARQAAKLSFLNLELHGIDFADIDGDGLGELGPYQPDLRIPLVKRMKTFSKVIEVLLAAGMTPVTLAEAAERLFI
ncbi:MAG: polysaccharide deacetylase family protein [Myxococcota bacterium]|nr:polysaccharide deacetylase family protein [Myxococcota bacterium]